MGWGSNPWPQLVRQKQSTADCPQHFFLFFYYLNLFINFCVFTLRRYACAMVHACVRDRGKLSGGPCLPLHLRQGFSLQLASAVVSFLRNSPESATLSIGCTEASSFYVGPGDLFKYSGWCALSTVQSFQFS